ncbi:hypothetical protein GGF46_004616 [Coemansia sp. RSA 552]|nr:hypothetical protein GGF46_004616 [Coemansia sp. RSA 552]
MVSRGAVRRHRKGPLFAVFLAVCLLLALLPAGGSAEGEKLCNQHEELCSRPFNDVTFISTHASFALMSPNKPSQPGTQFKGIKDQLNDGVRGLHLNIVQGTSASEVKLCYPDCDVNDGGALVDTLKTVKQWLDDNKGDVVTIFLEGQGTDASPSGVVEAFEDSGIDKYAYSGKTDSWPTLGKMVDDGTTLVVFAEDAAIAAASPKGYLIPYAGTVLRLEGPFGAGEAWTCGPWGHTTENIMVIPHYIVQTATYNGVTYKNMPYPFSLGITNGYQYENHAVDCRSGQSIWMNFMEVDFYDQGDVKTPTLKMNSLPYDGDSPENFYPEFFEASSNVPNFSAAAPTELSSPVRLLVLAACLSLSIWMGLADVVRI